MRIFLDTNIVGWIYENPKILPAFVSRIKFGHHRIGCSIELMFELGNNPDTAAAVTQLKLLGTMVDWSLLSYEPKHLIGGEICYALDGKPMRPYYDIDDAKAIYERFLSNIKAGTVESIRAWAKSRNKGFFQREKADHDEIENLPEASQLKPDTPFATTLDSFKKSGLCEKFLRDFCRRVLKRELSLEDLARIFSKTNVLPAIDTLLTHHVAYFHFRHILKQRPFKKGSNMDARHLVSASRANLFLSNDIELLHLVSVAGNRWRFKAQQAQRFLVLPN